MTKHYFYAGAAVAFAILWGFNVSEGDAVRASVNVLFVAGYVYFAEQSRKDAA